MGGVGVAFNLAFTFGRICSGSGWILFIKYNVSIGPDLMICFKKDFNTLGSDFGYGIDCLLH